MGVPTGKSGVLMPVSWTQGLASPLQFLLLPFPFFLSSPVSTLLSSGAGSCNCQAPVASLGAEAVLTSYQQIKILKI